MANFLASIFGTEQDKVNCSFYYKIGACRHGDRCSRKHVKPSYSQTILMPNLYHNPAYDPAKQAAAQQQHRQEQQQNQQNQQNQLPGGPPMRPPPMLPAIPPSASGGPPGVAAAPGVPGSAAAAAAGGAGGAAGGGGTVMNEQQLQNHFDAFYEDVWCEMCTKYGELEELVVCDNNNDHLVGNVYARFKYEDAAQRACDDLNGRWYAARPVYCELSPVTDFREACCRLNSGEGCIRGGFCNFIHRKNPSAELERELDMATRKWLRERPRDARSPTRSPSPPAEERRRRY